VPAEWVAAPEGKFAHSIKLPNPLPKDSGYKPGMSSEQYFDHLCKTEAGEFLYKTVENVEGCATARFWAYRVHSKYGRRDFLAECFEMS
jgi:hypothetical protein